MDLNEEQTNAAKHIEGPLLVLAGAGSGKTRVVTHRIAHLIDIGIMPSDILAVTFTNKAASEMRKRVQALKGSNVLTCTFHSLGARILRESISALGYNSDFTIYDAEDSEKLLKSCLQSLNRKEEKGLARKLKSYISSAKNDLLSPDEIDISEYPMKEGALFLEIYPFYQAKLKECNALDFDDLLFLTVKLFQEHPEVKKEYENRWHFVLIDEYQDTNLAQYTLAKALVEKRQNIFAVGDPDQSIYSWRGARYQNILNFSEDFPGAKVIRLEQNYRSTNTILNASNALIENNESRYDKHLWSALGDGDKIGIYIAQNERGEADFVMEKIREHLLDGLSPDEIVIFYRTNAQSRIFEDALLSKRLAYQIIGGFSFYQRREIKDILAFLRIVFSSADLISFARTINLPKRGLGLTTIKKLSTEASRRGEPIFSFLTSLVENPKSTEIRLSSRQIDGIREYTSLIHSLRGSIQKEHRISDVIKDCISLSRYEEHLKEDPDTFEDRNENLEALISKAAEWEEETDNPSLLAFLEELSLKATSENDAESSIKLMTLHNGKGLEFELVFLVGMEEDLLPHINSKDSPEQLEEERRLCYVGMTRAKRNLFLSGSYYRYLWGSPKMMTTSRFLKEIPSEYLENHSPTEIYQESISHQDGLFSPGSKVKHKDFGIGTIQKTYQTSYGLTYDINFEEMSMTRSLVAKYAKLESC